MTTSNQWSLFTAFAVFTLCALIAATMNWFGVERVILTLLLLIIFASLLLFASFLLTIFEASFRRRFKQTNEELIIEPAPKTGEQRLEIVIAAAENGLVNEPNSSIRYLDPPVNDHDIANLADYGELKWLILDNTDVSDAGLAVLHGMTKLRRIYIRGSRVTAAGVAQLRDALPDATILY